MKLKDIADTLLDEASPSAQLQAALNAFVQQCSAVGGVIPDRDFDAWAGDSLLQDGVAISPEAAAHCVHDTQRTVVFIRAAFAAVFSGASSGLLPRRSNHECHQAARRPRGRPSRRPMEVVADSRCHAAVASTATTARTRAPSLRRRRRRRRRSRAARMRLSPPSRPRTAATSTIRARCRTVTTVPATGAQCASKASPPPLTRSF